MDKLSVELRKQVKRIKKAVLKVLPEAERVSVNNDISTYGSAVCICAWVGGAVIAVCYSYGMKTTKQIVESIRSGELRDVRG